MAVETQEVNWQDKLKPEELYKDDKGNEFVYLHGLRRLAAEKGIVAQTCQLNTVVLKKPDTGVEYPFVQAVVSITFEDGTTFTDAADAHTYNLTDFVRPYPTTMAKNRAEARALRVALGINLVSKEELGAGEDAAALMSNEITTAQERVIKNLMKTRGVKNQMDVIKNATAREDVVDISELTNKEAKVAIKWLNSKKV